MNAAARKVVLTAHARAQALRRGLSETTVLNIAQSPEERIALRLGREIRQSRLRRQGGKL